MLLSEYRREVKSHSLRNYLKELMYSLNMSAANKKGRTDYSDHQITSRNQKPPVIETIADYEYNRNFYH
ncbi:hypothetical protein [Virgibacillus ndiopensis]|uniref:hypothetical protein n=1 Tax=Virgibacillus ndiopensis TaxID=2004408 RepID=UPI000C08670A|nr:hypothetical protein [Virgibacillus ndiopensis]